jgi:2'-hydroxyisoflavone reductase
MDILALGGTGFVGSHLVRALLAAGHRVATLTRGRAADTLPIAVERLHGDRDHGAAGLQALSGRSWDVCLDVSGYTPRQVRASTELLRARVRRYVFVSAVRAYGEPQQRPVLETHPRMPLAADDVTEVNDATYGALKVACEDIVERVYGERCTILRPQVVVGPDDPMNRCGHWVQRALRGGEMLAPGDGSDHLQFIDVLDVARFAAAVVERDLSGAFNLAGPRFTWAHFIALLGARDVVWVPAHVLEAAGLRFNELPMYRPEHSARAALMDVSNARARAAGLMLTEPQVTLARIRDAVRGGEAAPALSPEREAELIARARNLS